MAIDYRGLSWGQQYFPDEQVDETVTDIQYPGGNPVYPDNPGLYRDRIMGMTNMPASNYITQQKGKHPDKSTPP